MIANLRERSYADKGTGANGWEHPISWCRDYDGGRSFYTGIGHNSAIFADRRLPQAPARRPALDDGRLPRQLQGDDRRELHRRAPDAPNNFTGVTPESQLNQIGEPHGLDVDSKGRVFYIGRAAKGKLPPITSWTDAGRLARLGHGPRVRPGQARRAARVAWPGTLDVFGHSGGGDELIKKEEGLIGIALDPNFDTNKYVYLHYTPYTKVDFVKHIGTRRVARFTFDEATGKLDLSSEKPIIEWQYQNHSCCHMGGDMGFDKDGNLYVLTGDTNSSGNTGGYSGNFAPPQFPAGRRAR